ncbi:MAG TPA: 5'-3'-deoxyribonucleotidase [Acidobacteriaceae bacterium]|nr:5'-3'-deoxyribonucleotidase [Acidobacteriaceae bacterium]
MKTRTQRICVDMDEVMADAVAEHLLRYNRDQNTSLTKADLLGKRFWQVVPEHHHAILDDYLHAEDFFADLDVMPDAPRVLAALQQQYEIFIATAAMEVPTSFNAKFAWLGEHFPFIPHSHIVFCGDKSILNADFLIDDNPRQLELFSGTGILYDAPHNVAVTGYSRVHNWREIEKFFLTGR